MSYPVSRAAAPPRRPARNVLYLDWEREFIPWILGRLRTVVRDGRRIGLPPPWKPGQHMALVGKTREGKTNFVVALLRMTRKWVLALDPKGEDETLSASGWTRVNGVPPKKRFPKEVREDLDDDRPVRLVVGMDTRTRDADRANRELMSDAIEYVRQAEGWTLYVDEHQILSDQRMFKLGPDIARMAISAARGKTSVITSMQYLSWVERAPARQASFIVIWRTRNRDLIKALSDETGRDRKMLAGIVDELPRFHCLVISDDIRAPMIITRPPKVG